MQAATSSPPDFTRDSSGFPESPDPVRSLR